MTYVYRSLVSDSSLRVLEVLCAKQSEEISVLLHHVDWVDNPQYEAISYVWGDPTVKVPIPCQGKVLEVTPNLKEALLQFRYHDRSRFCWADALW